MSGSIDCWLTFKSIFSGEGLKLTLFLVKNSRKEHWFLKIEVQFIYSVIISALHPSDSVVHVYTFFFIFFSIMFYHNTLNVVPCAV